MEINSTPAFGSTTKEPNPNYVYNPKGGRPPLSRPMAKSKVGKLYDLFVANPMKPFSLTELGGLGLWPYARARLIHYGLDIRRHSPKHYWLYEERPPMRVDENMVPSEAAI